MFGERAKDAIPPLIFAIIKPLTPPDIKLTFLDENIEPVQDTVCDAVAISMDTFTARRSYTLASGFRTRGIPVILGGIHATLCPDEAAQHANSVVTGEAEGVWGDVVSDLRAGKLKPRYISASSIDLSKTRYDYSVFAGKKYNPVGLIQFSRGCKFNCDFCSVHAIYGSMPRTRPAAAVAQTIRQLRGKVLLFADDNFFTDPERANELLAELKPLKRRWVCQISMDAARDLSLLCRLRQSGCVMVIMGFESLEKDNLLLMNKNPNLAADYSTVIENVRKAGLMLYGTFVIGYSADMAETALRLAAYAQKHGFAVANFNPLIPLPGAGLYERLRQEGRLLYDDWWNDPSYRYGDTAFQPRGMSPEQLAESCRRARYVFYSFKGILSRLRGVNAKGFFNIWVYLLINFVSGMSIRHKQGRRLG